jgi:hypothetical protein
VGRVSDRPNQTFRIDRGIPRDTARYRFDTLGITCYSFVNRDFERFKKTLILAAEFDGTGGFEDLFLILGAFLVVGPAIKSNGGFENHEDIEPGLPDFTNGFRDALRLGKGFVDRISQFLHQDLQIVVHFAFLPWAAYTPVP